MGKGRWLLLIVISALIIVSAFGIKDMRDKRAEHKRQIEYQSVLKEYSGVLKPGMSRHEAESYLQSKGLSFRQMCCVGRTRTAWADLVRIGEEKPPWYCNQYDIYVAFEFETAEPRGTTDARDSDRLVDVTLFPWLEECL
jgi:hypothetical protein